MKLTLKKEYINICELFGFPQKPIFVLLICLLSLNTVKQWKIGLLQQKYFTIYFFYINITVEFIWINPQVSSYVATNLQIYQQKHR